jgi:hypothetical protein
MVSRCRRKGIYLNADEKSKIFSALIITKVTRAQQCFVQDKTNFTGINNNVEKINFFTPLNKTWITEPI